MLILAYISATGELMRRAVPAWEAAEQIAIATAAAPFFWLDLSAPTPEEAEVLSNVFHFHRLEIEDALEDVQHPKLEEYEDHLFLIVHSAPDDTASQAVKVRELDVFLSPKWLVTHHTGEIKAIEAARRSCEHQPLILQRSPAYLAYQIMDRLVENYDPLLDSLDDQVSSLEDLIFSDPTPEVLPKLFALKRTVMEVRRIAIYQRDVFARLARHGSPLLTPEMGIYFRDVYDHLVRTVDTSENLRDELISAMEAYLSQASNRLNEIMKFLTAISTLFIPLTFVTGFFGMNFDFLPLMHSPNAFIIMVFMMIAIAGLSRWYFGKRGWI